MNCLILGDGNFSFSKSFLNNLERNKVNYNKLIFTSYDSKQEIIKKYPESKQILEILQRNKKVIIKHNIDATKVLISLLNDNNDDREDQEDQNSFNSSIIQETKEIIEKKEEEEELFDYIIFNFPHIGVENYILHSSMLGHILYQVKKVLKFNGIFYLSLADDQPVNWKLDEMCLRNNFTVYDSYPFYPNHWIGYDMRRHQIGKSFQQRAHRYTTFCLVHKNIHINLEESSQILMDLFQSLTSSSIQNDTNSNENKNQLQTITAVTTTITTTTTTNTIDNQKNKKIEIITKKPREKKRKVNELTSGLYQLLDSRDPITGLQQYQCSECEKLFTLEQGVKTHVYMTHILSSSSSSSSSLSLNINSNNVNDKSNEIKEEGSNSLNSELTSSLLLSCDVCNPQRYFSNEEALFQHNRAKHSSIDKSLIPILISKSDSIPVIVSNTEKSIDVSENSTNIMKEEECPICGIILSSSFPTSTTLEKHLQEIIPPIQLDFECHNCLKIFHSQRSLSQHLKFCILEGQIESSQNNSNSDSNSNL